MNPEDDPPFRDASLLRVFLLGEIDARPGAQAPVGASPKQADAEVASASSSFATPSTGPTATRLFFGRAALENGLRRHAMEADWARWVIDELDGRHGAKADPESEGPAARTTALGRIKQRGTDT